jgi:GDPmannose 4,6-dehydratase
MARVYRVAYELPTCSAILYNHESPRRASGFVSIKVARAVARIKKGLQKDLILGSLEGRRDWGWAPDYVEGMWMMLQQQKVDDFVLATGILHSVEDLVACAFQSVGLNYKDYVKQDTNLFTSVEPVAPCGNPSKANRTLGWKNKVPFKDMIHRLVESELSKLS